MSSYFPTDGSAPDAAASQAQYDRDTHLGAPSRYGADPYRRTFSSAMSQVIAALQRDQAFAGVQFTESAPDDMADCPRVSWKLKSRVAGAGGQNRKNAYLTEEIPLEGGRTLLKSRQPMTFEVAFEVFNVDTQSADDLRDSLELWLFDNKAVAAQAGIECLVFQSEVEPGIVQDGSGQTIYRRTLYFTGVIQYAHSQVLERLKAFRIWHANEGVVYNTLPVVRQSASDDLFPVPGPLVLAAVHRESTAVTGDYLYGVDYELVIDREQYGPRFFLRWLPRGIAPAPGSTYYATYYLPQSSTATVVSEADGALPLLPGARRRRQRPPIGPKILGQRVDAADPLRDRTIVFASEAEDERVVPVTRTFLESLLRAESQLVAVVDPQAAWDLAGQIQSQARPYVPPADSPILTQGLLGDQITQGY